MTQTCSWCLKPGAKTRVRANSDGTLEVWRFFCDTKHQANWETNQPRPEGAVRKLDGSMHVDDLVKEANLRRWGVNNCFQWQIWGSEPQWRINLQEYTPEGSSLSEFSDFADGATMSEALHAAILNMEVRTERGKGPSRLRQASPEKMAEVWKLFHEVMGRWVHAGT